MYVAIPAMIILTMILGPVGIPCGFFATLVLKLLAPDQVW